MSGCTVSSKICLVVVGLIFWGAAAGLFYLGGWVFETYKHYDELSTATLTLIPATIVLVIGVFMFILGIVGCVSACKENKCLLAVFFSLMLIVLVLEITGGSLGYAFKKDLESTVRDGLTQARDKYNDSDTSIDHQLNYLQETLKCCGVNSSLDWLTAKLWKPIGLVPKSCCNPDSFQNSTGNCSVLYPAVSKHIYQEGCLEKLEDEFTNNLKYIISVAVAFAIIQVLGMISSCVLFCRTREIRYEVLGGPNSGLRV